MKTRWLSILVVAFAIVPARAQSPQPDPAPVLEAMKAVAFLEGRWAGDGWIQMGPGPKEEFSQTEVIERKLDGGLLLIEGIGRSRDPEPKTVHHAAPLSGAGASVVRGPATIATRRRRAG